MFLVVTFLGSIFWIFYKPMGSDSLKANVQRIVGKCSELRCGVMLGFWHVMKSKLPPAICLDKWWWCNDWNSSQRSDNVWLTDVFLLRKIWKSTIMADSYISGILNNFFWILHQHVKKRHKIPYLLSFGNNIM